ncbi:hypothetical protein Q5752_003025 [Cryptotrichosporon argae]
MSAPAFDSLAADPYLAYRPAFAYTLPIQVLAAGITLTLLVVLLIHLLFTTQYHYPLAPLNYALQLASVLSVLGTLLTKIIVVLGHSTDTAGTWPYDLQYIAVPIPPASWSTAQQAVWLLFLAINNGLAHITHIQFLTLLYPSRTEARLILLVLGPLAVAASGITFTSLSPNRTVYDLGDAVRNVFNSTLLLIYGFSLAIWGLAVNRRRAWRTDGGTAVFGGGALTLAAITTAGNFVAIKEDGLDWLQHLLWAAVLWQTWLGWWWWVGAGMGIGEVEDMIQRAERRKRRAARRARTTRVPAPTEASTSTARRLRATGLVGAVRASTTAVAGFTSGLGLASIRSGSGAAGGGPRRRRRASAADVEEGLEAIEMADRRSAAGSAVSSRRPSAPGSGPEAEGGGSVRAEAAVPEAEAGPTASTQSETSTTSRTPSLTLTAPRTLGAALAFPYVAAAVYVHKLKRAHADAARARAADHAHRRSRAYIADDGRGWGLGSSGLRERAEGDRRLRAAAGAIRAERLIRTDTADSASPPETGEAAAVGVDEAASPAQDKDADWEDVRPAPGRQPDHNVGTGFSWWGPLREWRLADRSTF